MISPADDDEQRGRKGDPAYSDVRQELVELGLWEVGMSLRDMLEVLNVVRDSKKSAENEQSFRDAAKLQDCGKPEEGLQRRYTAATDRRLPWSILPQDLKPSQKKQIIVKYWQATSRTQYARAKFNINFAPWPAPIEIPSSNYRSVRSTRSGRSAPKYSISDDDSEEDTFSKKIKKKRVNAVQNTNNVTKPAPADLAKPMEKRKLAASSLSSRRETKSSSPEIEIVTVEAQIHREGSPINASQYNFPPSPEEPDEPTTIKRVKKNHSS